MTNIATNLIPKDALNRGPFLNNLTKLITRLDKGVIAIDGEWGVGMTWLGESLKLKLDQVEKTKTIWLNLFEADWSDDPAISLIAGIAEQLEPEKSQAFLKSAAPILAAILPVAAKAAIKATANFAGLDEETTKELADTGKTEATKYIQKHLEAAKEKQKNLTQLKDLLIKTVTENGYKLVIFLDELDRCSPRYAVSFLERIKHIFDLQGTVYVLLWNRDQIQRTVEAFYGAGSNGPMYLDKFIDYPLHIPASQIKPKDQPPMAVLIDSITSIVDGEERDAAEQKSIEKNARLMAEIAQILNLTARETKRLAAWWVMSPNRPFPVIDTWLLGLKVKHPDIFTDIRNGNHEAHGKALELLRRSKRYKTAEIAEPRVLQALAELHDRFRSNTLDDFTPDLRPLIVDKLAKPNAAVNASLRRLEFDFG